MKAKPFYERSLGSMVFLARLSAAVFGFAAWARAIVVSRRRDRCHVNIIKRSLLRRSNNVLSPNQF
jgi:hypothetical protein